MRVGEKLEGRKENKVAKNSQKKGIIRIINFTKRDAREISKPFLDKLITIGYSQRMTLNGEKVLQT